MDRVKDNSANDLPTHAWDVLEDRIASYERDRAQDIRRPLEEYLPPDDSLLRRMTLVELIKVDLELEWKAGRRPTLQDYCGRCSELGSPDALPSDLVFEAYRTARAHGAANDPNEFCRPFPRQREAVRRLAEGLQTISTSLTRLKPRMALEAGTRIGDFQLIRLLGEGSFAKVFLARQISLDRDVALKVSADVGNEARTLASLEHDHIVRVFSETIDPERKLRVFCMQYVPGTDLGSVLRSLHGAPAEAWSGNEFLDAVDALATQPEAFDLSALRDRQYLEQADGVETVCWIGGRLADALAAAHARGILHRDVKPANVLVDRYGRPMLSDFNLSLDPRHLAGTSAGLFGGTLAYMAPEHLDAFNPDNPTPPMAVDARSDVYSLGVVLFEMAVGRRPFENDSGGGSSSESIARMAAVRREQSLARSHQAAAVWLPLKHVLRRCLHPDADQRYAGAAALSETLDSVCELRETHNHLPRGSWLTRRAAANPVITAVAIVLLPHVLGSVVNIGYNSLRIVQALSETQKDIFLRLILGYNAVAYPLAVFLVAWRALPVFRVARGVRRSEELLSQTVRTARRRVVSLPLWVVAVSSLGWLPGGLLFPLGIHLASGPLEYAAFGHFVLSFTLSGLIAMTYSFFGVAIIAFRVMYPVLWSDDGRPRQTARHELKHVDAQLWVFQLLAGAIPLIGAILLVSVGPEQLDGGYRIFRLLVTALIVLGMAGFGLAIGVANQLFAVLTTLTGKTRPG